MRLVNRVGNSTWTKRWHHHHLSLLGSLVESQACYRLCRWLIVLFLRHVLWNFPSTTPKISIRLTDQRTFEKACASECRRTVEETIVLCLQLNIVIWSILVILAYIVGRLGKRDFKLDFVDDIKVHFFAEDNREILVIIYYHVGEHSGVDSSGLKVNSTDLFDLHLYHLWVDPCTPNDMVNFLLFSSGQTLINAQVEHELENSLLDMRFVHTCELVHLEVVLGYALESLLNLCHLRLIALHLLLWYSILFWWYLWSYVLLHVLIWHLVGHLILRVALEVILLKLLRILLHLSWVLRHLTYGHLLLLSHTHIWHASLHVVGISPIILIHEVYFNLNNNTISD